MEQPRAACHEAVFAPLTQSGMYKRLLREIRGGAQTLPLFGMPENGKAPLLAALFEQVRRSMLIVCASDFAAQKLYAALEGTLGEDVHLLPMRTVHLSKARVQDKQNQGLRAAALDALCGDTPGVVVASVDAARARLLPVQTFASNGFTLQTGEQLDLLDLAEALERAGYARVETVDAYGQFAVRGGIVDVFLPNANAYRIDFFGDEIDSIRLLDPLSQRSSDAVEQCRICPAIEMPLNARQAKHALDAINRAHRGAQGETLVRLNNLYLAIEQGDYSTAYEVASLFLPTVTAADYLPAGGLLCLDEPMRLGDAAQSTDTDIATAVRDLAQKGEEPRGWDKHLAPYAMFKAPEEVCTLRFSALMRGGTDSFYFAMRPAQPFHGRMDLLCEDLLARKRQGWRTLLVLQNEKRCESLFQSLQDRDVPCTLQYEISQPPEKGQTLITRAPLGAGFEMQEEQYLVLSEAEIFRNQSVQRAQKKGTRVAAPALELKEGDYAVHDIHGIGIYRGLKTIEVEGRPKDFMMMEYKGGDKLYIPAEQMGRVQKYIGSDDAAPKVSKMGGQEWDRTKKKVSSSVKKLAQDLVAIYAARQALKGYAFSPDTVWQQEFEQAFAFEETEGQLQSVEEIKRDMESPRIMDRLLCGDVGYGKTEVAMRAAFKCVMDAKQVMVLVPTTVLAQQHYATMSARFEGYPIEVEVLSRFKSKKEQEEILDKFAQGHIDVLIGTHRLLAKDVKPHDLGLLIVDEEQRFGVGHKETIKDIKRTVDVLTMTATPIPRTMEMSLVGIRDMSVIHTPPTERVAIHTAVCEYDDELVKEAITRELARGGQAYILYNQVQKMERFVEHLEQLVPQARFAMAHGQMHEATLEKAMLSFYEGETDVLVCSTIIESGLDIPTANTMIIIDADRLGLAQLYQLRGRVGRSTRTAYCYLTYQPQRALSETAEKRLQAIREFTELGSGFRIAMRDLEIRGAGNLLGPEQHGQMHNVGYDTYCRLLADAIRQARGEEVEQVVETTVDVPLTAHIPASFIPSREQKVQAYRRIADLADARQAQDMCRELQDRYGKVPQEVQDLVQIALLRAKAGAQGVQTVIIRDGLTRIRFAPQAHPDPQALLKAMQAFGPGAQMVRGDVPGMVLRMPKASARVMMEKTLAFFQSIPAG